MKTPLFLVASVLLCLELSALLQGQTAPTSAPPAPAVAPAAAPAAPAVAAPGAPAAAPAAATAATSRAKPPDPCRYEEDPTTHRVIHPDPPDIVWYVVPPNVVEDNYGKNVRNKFVMIDVTVKNVCQEDQISILSFAIRPDHDQAYWDNNDPYKNTDPVLVRGTIEKSQQVGFRNRGVQIIKTAGLMASGAAGYFKADGPRANYNLGVDIFSNPFEKGIELIFPDTTIQYLNKWDKNQIFKNGFVVEPGKELPGAIFIPIRTVCSKDFAPLNKGEKCQEGGLFHGPHYDPELLKQRIGKLSVIGEYVHIESRGSFR